MIQFKKLQTAHFASNVVGQIVLDCIMDPPLPGDESYDLFMKVAINLILKQNDSPISHMILIAMEEVWWKKFSLTVYSAIQCINGRS